jgi:hypothetical protein
MKLWLVGTTAVALLAAAPMVAHAGTSVSAKPELSLQGGNNGDLTIVVPRTASLVDGKVTVNVRYTCSNVYPAATSLSVGINLRQPGTTFGGDSSHPSPTTCDGTWNTTTIVVGPNPNRPAFQAGAITLQAASIQRTLSAGGSEGASLSNPQYKITAS